MPLRVADRDERFVPEHVVHRAMLGHVEPSVERRHERRIAGAAKRQREVVHVRVDHVEGR
jgi:hypothetical protein